MWQYDTIPIHPIVDWRNFATDGPYKEFKYLAKKYNVFLYFGTFICLMCLNSFPYIIYKE